MANAVLCRFSFSDDWTGLQKMLVFTNGIETRDVMLDGDECYIPHEVLSIPRVKVRVGVYGTDGENVRSGNWAVHQVKCEWYTMVLANSPSGAAIKYL